MQSTCPLDRVRTAPRSSFLQSGDSVSADSNSVNVDLEDLKDEMPTTQNIDNYQFNFQLRELLGGDQPVHNMISIPNTNGNQRGNPFAGQPSSTNESRVSLVNRLFHQTENSVMLEQRAENR